VRHQFHFLLVDDAPGWNHATTGAPRTSRCLNPKLFPAHFPETNNLRTVCSLWRKHPVFEMDRVLIAPDVLRVSTDFPDLIYSVLAKVVTRENWRVTVGTTEL
jgi:hypothetical protein